MTSTEVGYIGGTKDHPTYEQVCSGATGHTEAVKVSFDPQRLSYKSLVTSFLNNHDAGVDLSFIHGGQYMNAIFVNSKEQELITRDAIAAIEKNRRRKVYVSVRQAGTFWRAEEYHQNYYKKHNGASCRVR